MNTGMNPVMGMGMNPMKSVNPVMAMGMNPMMGMPMMAGMNTPQK